MRPMKIHDFLYPKYDPGLSQKLVTSSFDQVLPTKFVIKICSLVLEKSKRQKTDKQIHKKAHKNINSW